MKKTGVDGLQHTRDESTELCIYHLRMAYAHFMNGAESLQDFLDVMKEQCNESYGLPEECNYHGQWLANMHGYHERLAKEHN